MDAPIRRRRDDRDCPTGPEPLHVADPPVPPARIPQEWGCRRRSQDSRNALLHAVQMVERNRAEGLVLCVLRKDGGADYLIAGEGLRNPLRASGGAARLLDLANRLPEYLAEEPEV